VEGVEVAARFHTSRLFTLAAKQLHAEDAACHTTRTTQNLRQVSQIRQGNVESTKPKRKAEHCEQERHVRERAQRFSDRANHVPHGLEAAD
jgi:hypothetical protein